MSIGSNASGGEELVQASIKIPDLLRTLAEREIVEAILRKPGVKSVNHHGDCLHVVYNPLDVSEHELERAIRASGHIPEHGDAERDSPFADEGS
jgi:hypothetical protein